MAHDEAQDAAWRALDALQRPATADAALACADATLGPLGLNNQFRKWWETNGAAVLRRLNGG